MYKFHWLESKQLDRVTNFSTEIEPLKYALQNNIKAYYYCTYAKEPKYFGLKNRIIYLSSFKNKYIKALEFRIRVVLRTLRIVITENHSVIMVNQDLVAHVLPARFINKLFKQNNKFIVDIRTTPTRPETFDRDMVNFHKKFNLAINFFHGFSFITPFMEKYVMQTYKKENYKSVNWSSGVDIDLFNPNNHKRNNHTKTFKIFYHGGISVSRGNLNLIKAVEILRNKGLDVELLQLGITVDNVITDYIETNALQDWCKLLPPVSIEQIPQFIADSDLPVLPFPNFMAWRVSSPIKLMEYLAMGKKVLAPNMEAFTDVFKSNKELLYYFNTNASDPVLELKNSIEAICNDDNFVTFNKECSSFVANNYTWDSQAQKLFNFAQKL
ncbi:MAG: glycosyltransferase [Winogradskyella sp.]|jgi:glycosyltransferase involved in cell wall biosynthesis